jgi:hypothetical protein
VSETESGGEMRRGEFVRGGGGSLAGGLVAGDLEGGTAFDATTHTNGSHITVRIGCVLMFNLSDLPTITAKYTLVAFVVAFVVALLSYSSTKKKPNVGH